MLVVEDCLLDGDEHLRSRPPIRVRLPLALDDTDHQLRRRQGGTRRSLRSRCVRLDTEGVPSPGRQVAGMGGLAMQSHDR